MTIWMLYSGKLLVWQYWIQDVPELYVAMCGWTHTWIRWVALSANLCIALILISSSGLETERSFRVSELYIFQFMLDLLLPLKLLRWSMPISLCYLPGILWRKLQRTWIPRVTSSDYLTKTFPWSYRSQDITVWVHQGLWIVQIVLSWIIYCYQLLFSRMMVSRREISLNSTGNSPIQPLINWRNYSMILESWTNRYWRVLMMFRPNVPYVNAFANLLWGQLWLSLLQYLSMRQSPWISKY